MRTLKSALESRWRTTIPDEHPVLTWMTEHASVVVNKCFLGADGKTAHERLRGKKATVLGVDFGEGIVYRTKPCRQRLAKLECMWQHGIYLGHRAASGESIVGGPNGIVKSRTIKRKPEAERWDLTNEKHVSGVPWRISEDDPEQDGLMASSVRMEVEAQRHEPSAETVPIPRRVHLTKEDFAEFGYTSKCQGCKSLLRGTARQGHTEQCRKRMEDNVKHEPKFKNAKKREHEFLAKALEFEDERMNKPKLAHFPEQIGDSTMNTPEEFETSGAAGSGLSPQEREQVPVQPPTSIRPEDDMRADIGEGGMDADMQVADVGTCEEKWADVGTCEEMGTCEEKWADMGTCEEKWDSNSAPQADGSMHERAELRRAMVKTRVRAHPDTTRAMGQDLDENPDERFINQERCSYSTEEVDTTQDLDPTLVEKPRAEEIAFMQKLGVWTEASEEGCWHCIGRGPVSTRWVDIDKGREGSVDVRSSEGLQDQERRLRVRRVCRDALSRRSASCSGWRGWGAPSTMMSPRDV